MRFADHLMVRFIVSPHAKSSRRILDAAVTAPNNRVKNTRARTTPHYARWLTIDAKFGRAPHGQILTVSAPSANRLDGRLPTLARVGAHVPDARRVYRR
jgi:hypothetical protein